MKHIIQLKEKDKKGKDNHISSSIFKASIQFSSALSDRSATDKGLSLYRICSRTQPYLLAVKCKCCLPSGMWITVLGGMP